MHWFLLCACTIVQVQQWLVGFWALLRAMRLFNLPFPSPKFSTWLDAHQHHWLCMLHPRETTTFSVACLRIHQFYRRLSACTRLALTHTVYTSMAWLTTTGTSIKLHRSSLPLKSYSVARAQTASVIILDMRDVIEDERRTRNTIFSFVVREHSADLAVMHDVEPLLVSMCHIFLVGEFHGLWERTNFMCCILCSVVNFGLMYRHRLRIWIACTRSERSQVRYLLLLLPGCWLVGSTTIDLSSDCFEQSAFVRFQWWTIDGLLGHTGCVRLLPWIDSWMESCHLISCPGIGLESIHPNMGWCE